MIRPTPNDSRSARVAQWVRDSLKPRSLLNGLVTLAWLAPLTVLIWIYADRAQVVQVDNVTIPIDVQSSGNRFVRLEMNDNDKSVIAQLVGPRSRIDQILQAVNPKDEKPTVIIPIDANLTPGVYPLDTAQQIMNSQVFQYKGVSVKDCKPARISVFVDDYREAEIEVQAPPNANLSSAVFTPAKVTVRAPQSLLENIRGGLIVQADLSKTNVLDKPGQHDATVAVASPQLRDQLGVTINPPTVKATLEVRPKNASTEIKSITVWVKTPADFARKYTVECTPPTLSNVKVTGPPDELALLEQNPPTATLVIPRDAWDGATHTGRPTIVFSPGTTDIQVDADSVSQVQYKTISQQPG